MINPLEEKKMLIESMKKLVSHVASNPVRQGEIFNALSYQDLNKIIINLKDDNQYLRRISALLLCELFFMNEQTKQKAIKLLNIVPSSGRICLGGIPESIGRYPSTLKRCIQLMRMPIQEAEEDKMCWVINLERKVLRIQTMEYKKYSSFTFIDPHKNIFGFAVKPKRSYSPNKVEMGTPKHSKIETHGNPAQNNQTNTQFYKNYVDARKKTFESKRGSYQGNYINLSSSNYSQSDRPSVVDTKPMTPHISVTLTPSAKRQSLRSSMDYSVKYNPNLTMTVGRNSVNMEKLANSTHIPGQYQKIGTNYFGKGDYGDDLKVRANRAVSGKESQGQSSRHNQDRFYHKVREVIHK